MFFSVIILFVALVFGIANTESLAQGQGFSLKGIQNSFNYLQEYTTQESKIDRTSTGRTSTTINTFNALLSNSGKIYGNGLVSLRGEITFYKYDVSYGVTGLVRELICVGIVGATLYMLFYIKLLLMMREGKRYMFGMAFDKNIFWIWILGISGVIALIITVLSYSRAFAQSLNPIIFVLIAVGISFRVINKLKFEEKLINNEKK